MDACVSPRHFPVLTCPEFFWVHTSYYVQSRLTSLPITGCVATRSSSSSTSMPHQSSIIPRPPLAPQRHPYLPRTAHTPTRGARTTSPFSKNFDTKARTRSTYVLRSDGGTHACASSSAFLIPFIYLFLLWNLPKTRICETRAVVDD